MLLSSILTKENLIAILVILAIITVFAVIFNVLTKKHKEVQVKTSQKRLIKDLIETSILVSLTVVLDLIFKMIPFMDMPQGGSVSLTMLPLLVIAYRNGTKWGVIGGVTYAIINLLLDGKLYHWSSIFLDYLFAFGVIGLAGVFKSFVEKSSNKLSYVYLVLGSSLVVVARLAFAVLSGIIAFETPFVPSLVYNAPYILISGALCIVSLCIIKDVIIKKAN